MEVKAGRYAVVLKELSWWDSEEIKSCMVSGAKMNGDGTVAGIDGKTILDVKVKTFEKTIVSIKEGEAEVKFSEAWLKGLTAEEGNVISEAVDELGKKK